MTQPQPYQQPYQGPRYPEPDPRRFEAPGPFPQSEQGYQPGYQQPYQAPQQAGYPAEAVCRICGNGPAAPATFRAVVGFVFMHTMWTARGPYCRDCGMHTFRRQTTKSLTGGWCSIGAIALTPVFVLMNLHARGKVAGLPAPRPRPDGRGRRPLDPGRPVHERPGAYVYPLLAALLVVAIVAANLAS